MKYLIEITETLQKVLEIEADTEKEAILMVKKMYKNEDIILYPKDYIDVKIDTYKK